jgi:hypothetical protein
MGPSIRRFAAVAAVISIVAGVGAIAEACGNSTPVSLPPEPDGSTGGEASADAPATNDVAETSTGDGPTGDGGAGDSGDAASDAPTGDAPTGDAVMGD